MANSEYLKTGGGSFATSIKLDSPLDRETTVIPFSTARIAQPIEVGMVAMVDGEIMHVTANDPMSITVKRGCADTIPAPHEAGLLMWIFDVGSVGSDRTQWNAGETIGVKVTPYTGAGEVPYESVIPLAVTFKFRFARPYPPAQVMANGARWYAKPGVNDATPMLHLSWVHRDRVLQADRLIGHDDASIGPEPGVTYTLRIYEPILDTLVRQEVGIKGNEFTYRRAQATHDLGNPIDVVEPYFTLTAVRDGLESWQHYQGDFTLVPAVATTSEYLAFDQRVIESPFVINAIKGMVPAYANFALGVAARPSDRMSDSFDMTAGGSVAAQGKKYTPWLTLEFRLPELETTINVRSSSLYDGVPLAASLVGKLLLIGGEIMHVVGVINQKQIAVERGCADTIPAIHLAGSRAWFFDAATAFDATERATDSTVDYRMRPGTYGPPIPLEDLPSNAVTFVARAARPYPPGQVVVNGRPWFEEAQAVAGEPVEFSWALRNRHTQSSTILAHSYASVVPEQGNVTRLLFYYETPSVTPGEPAVVNVLRLIDVAYQPRPGGPPQQDEPDEQFEDFGDWMGGRRFTYTYAMAQADGDAAGRALGICGTVVIYCRILSANILDGFESYQSYVVPIRVPSYPC